MTLLAPLGLLALISLIILLIIYIIRPNFQHRIISSTYIWKLSLKYKKKRVPINKLRNLLLIICQVLILTCCAIILSQPNKILLAKESGEEAIIIIDTSASMRIESVEGDVRESRFERAVTDAIDLAYFTFSKEGKVSVILADEEPNFLLGSRLTYMSANSLYAELRALLEDEYACSYGTADIDTALTLCEDIIFVNNDAQVYLYTDVEYPNVPKGVNVEFMAYEEDWNVSILNAYTLYEDNYYNFYVEVACYGQNFSGLNLKLEVRGCNDSQDKYVRMADASKLDLVDGTVYTIAFRHTALADGIVPPETMIIQDLGEQIYLFDSVYVSIVDSDNKNTAQIFAEDGLFEDNEFYIYGGRATRLNVQYVSTLPHTFLNGALLTLRKYYESEWDIRISTQFWVQDAEMSGYDLYIFEEGEIPSYLPSDGVSLIISPYRSLMGGGVITSGSQDVTSTGGLVPTVVEEHPILNGLNVENIIINRYIRTSSYDQSTYKSILEVPGNPLILVANTTQEKVVYFNFNLHYSNLPLLPEFPLLMYNVFEYFFPPMVEANSFEVNEEFTLRARGESMMIKGGDFSQEYTTFPAKAKLSLPGTYTVSQETFSISESGAVVVSKDIYVRLPAEESNAHFAAEDAPHNPYAESNVRDFYEDLLLYVAIALTALMFAEWLLQVRDNM